MNELGEKEIAASESVGWRLCPSLVSDLDDVDASGFFHLWRGLSVFDSQLEAAIMMVAFLLRWGLLVHFMGLCIQED